MKQASMVVEAEGDRFEVSYALSDRQLARVFYRNRRPRKGWVLSLVYVAAVGLALIFWSDRFFAPEQKEAWQIVGGALILAAPIAAAWRVSATRRAFLQNVRDNSALLRPVSLPFDTFGLRPPYAASGDRAP